MEIIEYRLPIASLEDFAEAHGLVMEIHERDPQWWARRDAFQPFYARFKGVERKDGAVLIGEIGEGRTPAEAVAHYARRISLKRIVVDAMSPGRREIKVPRLK